MHNSDCFDQVEATILNTGYGSLSQGAKAWVELYCAQGMPADWIASRLNRLLDLKAFLDGMKARYPSLTDAEILEISQDYLDGEDVDVICEKADSMSATFKIPKPI